MSFWKTSEGQKVEQNDSFEIGGGDIPPMPKGTDAISMPTEVKWSEHEGVRYINIRWDVVDGEYKNRVVFQKLWIYGDNPDPQKTTAQKIAQGDKHKRMLAAIDANAGGKLMQVDREPTDMELASALCNKPMLLKFGTWDDKETKLPKGNWVMAVQSAKGGSKPQAKPAQPIDSFDDDVGF